MYVCVSSIPGVLSKSRPEFTLQNKVQSKVHLHITSENTL